MPFLNKQAWISAQQECHELRRTFAHLRAGTRPSRKTKGMRNVKRYLNIASIDNTGLLVVRKSDPYLHQRELTIVPRDILPGILHALHLHFTHCSESQLSKLFHRYFYSIASDNVIKSIIENCQQCVSMKKVPKEVFEQTSSASPTSIGQQFAADVIKRNKQAIFSLRDIHSAFTTAMIVPDETGPSLRGALISCSSNLRAPTCSVRLDNAPGLITLKNDPLLRSQGITLDHGRVKNVNRNPCAEKCNQELEQELLRVDSSGAPVTDATLQMAVRALNSRIRNRGLSAKEIVTCRDQVTNAPLRIDDLALSQQQEQLREKNHPSSSRSKAPNGLPATEPGVTPGSLVYIKEEGDKFHPRELYIIVNITDGHATVQKFRGRSFMSKQYSVPLTRLYPLSPGHTNHPESESSSEEEEPPSGDDSSEDVEEVVQLPDNNSTDSLVDNRQIPRRSGRERREPQWLASGEWEK